MKDLWAAQNYADSLNLIRIKEIIKQYGYSGESLVGNQSSTAWLVIQHADLSLVGNQSSTAWLVIQHADLEAQEQYLPILQDAANKGELPKSSFALLVDRVRM